MFRMPMKKNVLILEDNIVSMNALVEIVESCQSIGAVFCASDVSEAYRHCMESKVDLFLIDIMLSPEEHNDVAGVIFADSIRQVKHYRFTPIIFITSLVDQQLYAFKNIHCYDYIEKPYDPEKLKKTLEVALGFPTRNEPEDKYIYYRKDGVLYSFYTETVIFMEGVGRDMIVHLEEEEIDIPYKTCCALKRLLNHNKFLQCNQNVIVNRHYIASVDRSNKCVTMKTGQSFPISRRFKESFFAELKNDN